VTEPSRPPTETEQAAETDFTAVQQAWEDDLQALIEQWQNAVTPAARAELLTQIEELVAEGANDQIGAVAVTAATIAIGAALVTAWMLTAATNATTMMLEEAARQGVTGIKPDPIDTSWLEGRANTAATLLTGGFAASAAKQAAAHAVPDADPASVADAVADHLDTLTDRALRDQLGAALSAAQNAGRLAVLSAADDTPRLYAAEILDANTCDDCKKIDGTRFGSVAEASAAYLTGGYVNCAGRERCRGLVVAVWPNVQARTHITLTEQGRTPMTDLNAIISDYRTLRARMQTLDAPPSNLSDVRDPGWRVERPQAAANADPAETAPTKIFIYSEIGGFFGVWPDEVAAELRSMTGPIDLHLHSPGGDAFDGVAIYNALRDYDTETGPVSVIVDGLAASAASVIAMAGRRVKMKRGSQLMIHDAWGGAIGPAEDMEKMRTFLDKISDSIAEIYASRAGGTADDWRTAMKAESWYRDKEAVEAGLADEVETSVEAAKNRWDLKVFAHAGRANAPDPLMPAGRWDLGKWGSVLARDKPDGYIEPPKETLAQATARIHAAAQRAQARTDQADSQVTDTPDAGAPAAGQSHTEGAVNMPFDRDKIREALGLGPDATDAAISEAFMSSLGGAPTPASPSAASGTPAPAAPAQLTAADLAKLAQETGAVLIDPAQLDEMRRMAALGVEAHNTLRVRERDEVVDQAIKAGKVALSRREHWQNLWDKDPEGTRSALNELKPNMIPVDLAGYSGTSMTLNEAEAALMGLYPEEKGRG
jgi:ATP-dependent protease ClpP protease subunit